MDDKLIERVARAIAREAAADYDSFGGDGKKPWREFRQQAKAALEAAGVSGLLEGLEAIIGMDSQIVAPANRERYIEYGPIAICARTALAKALGDE